MAGHLSDDEQLETLKRWWSEKGKQLLLIVLVVVGGWFGWQQWSNYQAQRAAEASLVYNEMVSLVGERSINSLPQDTENELRALADSLLENYAGSQYARFAELMLASLAVAKDDLISAATYLQRVIDASKDVELANIARLRLARVELAQKNYAKALADLDVNAPGMTAIFAELRGDIYYRMGDYGAARAAYQSAVNGLGDRGSGARPLLELKLNRVLDEEYPQAVETKDKY